MASIIGQIISMAIAIGPVSTLRTRTLHSVLNTRSSWADKLYLSREAQEELQFGLESVELSNRNPILCSHVTCPGWRNGWQM